MIIKSFLLRQRGWINGIVILAGLFILAGCTTSGNAIPAGGPTMAQVYEEAMQRSNGETLEQARQTVAGISANQNNNAASTYTRTASNEINNLFPLLPDPQLVMYVYPHLAGQDEAPVPGYATAFPLYDRVHYALPGEL